MSVPVRISQGVVEFYAWRRTLRLQRYMISWSPQNTSVHPCASLPEGLPHLYTFTRAFLRHPCVYIMI